MTRNQANDADERTVQVPVSLIEHLARELAIHGAHDTAAGLLPLLSQPTATPRTARIPDDAEQLRCAHCGRFVRETGCDSDHEPTPTAEPDHHLYRAVRLADGLVAGPWMPGERAQISDRNEWREEMSSDQGWIAVASAEPPRIEDMAPEHSYEAMRTDIISALAADGFSYLESEQLLRRFESTIRDVTPPTDVH